MYKRHDTSLAEYVQSGFKAFEPSFTKVEEVHELAPLLKKYKLALPSFYVNSTLHDAAVAQQSIESVLAIAKAAQPCLLYTSRCVEETVVIVPTGKAEEGFGQGLVSPWRWMV